MKKFIYTIGFALLLPFTVGAQATISNEGIGFQGILRNAGNVALVNSQANIDVLVALESGEELFNRESVAVTTNVNGVFSYMMNLDDKFYAGLAKHLGEDIRIKVFLDEQEVMNTRINPMPFAISSGNGVPVGAILPFTGSVVPKGFLRCDGDLIPSGSEYAALKTLLGNNNVPDLRGMFLRGSKIVGADSGEEWPEINQVQEPTISGHKHTLDTFSGINEQTIDTYGESEDAFAPALMKVGPTISDEWNGLYGFRDFKDFFDLKIDLTKHDHRFVGSTVTENEPKETRPYNYGVNYIIKY